MGLRALILILALSISCSEIFAQDGSQSFRIRRAINVETFIVLRPKVDGHATFPYYDLRSPTFGRKHPKALKAAGFDGVRLAIEPAPLLNMGEAERLKVYPLFADAINDFIESGLKVVLDLHVTNQDPDWSSTILTAQTQSAKFERYLEVVASVSGFLSSYDPRLVAMELFNEPPCIEALEWSQIQKRTYAVARSILPAHSLILTGACLSSLDDLQQIHIGDYDNNTIFTFHFYEPAIFTHQGIPWINDFKYVRRVPYPPEKDRADKSITSMEAEVNAEEGLKEVTKFLIKRSNRNSILRYVSIPMDRQWIEKQIAKVRSWSDQSDLSPGRIFVGEFGANRDWGRVTTVAPEDRLRWLHDVRVLLEEAGYPWAVWSDCCTFGITVSGDEDALDPAVLKSLGMSGEGPLSK
jgi:hypothetical protein